MSELTRANRVAAVEAANNGPLAPERGVSKQLTRLLATLPPGRRRVAMALIADNRGRTYPEVAAKLGVRLGTVHGHLRRIRRRHPQVWAAVMKARARQLRARHRRALTRATAHSKRWHEITKGRHLLGSSR
jgi:FixJ family two-component response regulator